MPTENAFFSGPTLRIWTRVPELGQSLRKKLINGDSLHIDIHSTAGAAKPSTITLLAHKTWTPAQLIMSWLSKVPQQYPGETATDYVVKVCGRVEYMLQQAPLAQYKYIRSCIAKQQRPQLTVVLKTDLYQEIGQPDKFQMPVTVRGLCSTPTGHTVSLFTLDSKLKVTILKATNVNADSIMVRAGVYHGGEPLSDIQCSRTASATGGELTWGDQLVFDVDVRDLPRSCRLCFVIYGTATAGEGGPGKKAKSGIFGRKRESVPLAWVNINLFNYNKQMRCGKQVLHCWSIDGALDETLNPIGTTVENPNTTSPTLVVELERYSQLQNTVVEYPSQEEIESLSRPSFKQMAPGHQRDQLHRIVELDPLSEIEEQDQELLWYHREYLAGVPQSLPKLLKSVKWNNRNDVAQMLTLLRTWKKVSPEQALELLDYQYADQNARSYAVECLRELSDNQLLHFLLQLVQVLKYESYLDCPLTRFLLERALRNQKIGHYLFWHLRAEMHHSEVAVRFGLLLEAYCRGSVGHMKSLAKQQEALTKMRATSELLQSKALKERPKGMKAMREQLESASYVESLNNLVNPLCPDFRLHKLKLDKCKFMDSKMKPLWLVWENADPLGSDIYLIYKNGDDLRQDMLTLQIIGIMDSIWQSEGLDMRMNPYGCMSTGDQVGLIEVVLQSNTIAKIQKEKGGGSRGAFDKSTLYKWLQEKNKDKEAFDQAIDAFTYSCAGYCVATYVLGIGDRHSDNIMLKETGQLFHIDFGHFLGNFKSKFGVKRERVPFVLTDDFVYVIAKGRSDSAEFSHFRKLCEQCFLLLRKRGALLINLFAMMLSTGIPELRSLDDINYVRDALVLGSTDDEALLSFRKKFDDALKNSWSVSWNWYIHNVVRN